MRWSRKYDKCVKCGTTRIKHQARGLCTYCYHKEFDGTPERKEYLRNYEKSPRRKGRARKRLQNSQYKEWQKEYQKKYRKTIQPSNYQYEHQVRSKYGISLAERDAIIKQQNNRCPICNELLIDNPRPPIDHNHKTGEIRGVLCRWCNLGIGWLREDIVILKNAISYLEKSTQK